MRIADNRDFQVLSLSFLLIFGLLYYNFEVSISSISVIFVCGLPTQLFFCKSLNINFDPKSSFITILSLSILLRGSLPVLALASFIAIASKFICRADGRHIFNPANIAIVLVLLFSNVAWVSPAQWGSELWLAFLLLCAGSLVINKNYTQVVPLVFIASYIALIFGRALYLGDPLAIPLKQLQNGALLIFTFFMISDPKTTPINNKAKIIFAIFTAVLAYVLQYHFYTSKGLFYALAISCSVVWLLRLLSKSLLKKVNRLRRKC